ncbi:hypothetical protein Syun_013455 [Stephania yunnanensis]|uniref:Uncharacterized protein n=1 Tax=Stephania yunnanensis TaxID=152371 RepID=A0AAP0PAV5_9MAGN
MCCVVHNRFSKSLAFLSFDKVRNNICTPLRHNAFLQAPKSEKAASLRHS